jgi:hypothetical protein
LISASRSARPMTAVARSLLASALKVELAPISRRTGPLMMTRLAHPMNEWTQDPKQILETFAAEMRANQRHYSI